MASVDVSNVLGERIVTLRVKGMKRLMLRMQLGLWLMRLALRVMGFGSVEMVTEPAEGVGG